MSATKAWAFYDAVTDHVGGCQMCGDDDEFSPNVEAFEDTGAIMCDLCFEAQEDAAREYHNMEVSPVYFPSDRVEIK